MNVVSRVTPSPRRVHSMADGETPWFWGSQTVCGIPGRSMRVRDNCDTPKLCRICFAAEWERFDQDRLIERLYSQLGAANSRTASWKAQAEALAVPLAVHISCRRRLWPLAKWLMSI